MLSVNRASIFAACVIDAFLTEAGLCADPGNEADSITNKDAIISWMSDGAVEVLALTRKRAHGAKKLLWWPTFARKDFAIGF